MSDQQELPRATVEETLEDLDAHLEALNWNALVSDKETRRLEQQLTQFAGVALTIVTREPVPPATTPSYPVSYQLETLAWVVGPAPDPTLAAAAGLLERVLYQAARYYLAANLHLEVVHRDYAALLAKHQALQSSEARYRDLSAELAKQVEAQVQQIEDRQRRMYAAEKLNAVGRLGAGVAHEINNPIGFIRSNLNSSREYIETFQQLRQRLEGLPGGEALVKELDLDWLLGDFSQLTEESLEGAERIGAIVAALRRFAGTDDQGPQQLAINPLLEGVWAVAAPRLGAQLEVTWQLQDKLPPLTLERAAISQVFYNLLENAAQSAPRTVQVTISTALASRVAESSSEIAGENAGESRAQGAEKQEPGLWVEIRDNGDGMTADTLTHLFDPFFTTKPVGSGTGLGLTVCRDTLLAMGGDIQASSAPGKGTRMRVWLPLPAPIGVTD
ncbi:MAG: hypothetical protein EA349_11150 [Halomonadaceae bacterium]|nr:MAG: hypothetical protein EA349_11150 [Halomonadaceae bacterium]